MKTLSIVRLFTRVGCLLLTGTLFSVFALFAADETCPTCGGKITVTGDFAHQKDIPYPPILGAGANFAVYAEDVNGPQFTVAIANLPAGKYEIEIGAAELTATAAGERVFTVSAGDTVLAQDFDLFASAGGVRKVATVRGAIEKADDALRGPLQLTFAASKGRAKFNTVTIRDSAGAQVVSFAANELADAFGAAAMVPPEVKEPAIWRDPSKPLRARADDLIRRMALAEKVSQLKNGAPAIPRLGLPAYDYWNEALHGIANNGFATVFPEPIGGAASWNPELFRSQGHVIGVEGRAKFNDYANSHNGDSKWWAGLTYWTPNVNISAIRAGAAVRRRMAKTRSSPPKLASRSSKASRATTRTPCWRWPVRNTMRFTAAQSRIAIVSMP
jgi:beta-glucosidase